MWFDARKALARIEAGPDVGLGNPPAATPATSATPQADAAPRVAEVAVVAGVQAQNPNPAPANQRPKGAAVPDADTYAAFLRDHGPATYGAAASELGWGATRAWQAEARLRVSGRIRFDGLGKAHLVEAAP